MTLNYLTLTLTKDPSGDMLDLKFVFDMYVFYLKAQDVLLVALSTYSVVPLKHYSRGHDLCFRLIIQWLE